MIAEAIAAIVKLTNLATNVQVLKSDELRKVFVRDQNGTKEYELPPQLRKPSVRTVADLVALLADQKIARAPEVYIGVQSAVVLLDRDMRDQRGALLLPYTTAFNALREIAYDGWEFGPKEMVSKLRRTFGDAVPTNVMSALRKVDFSRKSTGKQHTEHGKESWGQSVEAEVQGAADFPTDFNIRTPVHLVDGLQYHMAEVEVGIELDLECGEICLFAVPDAIERALIGSYQYLQHVLQREAPGLPIFFGEA